jgi:hypothetical protein
MVLWNALSLTAAVQDPAWNCENINTGVQRYSSWYATATRITFGGDDNSTLGMADFIVIVAIPSDDFLDGLEDSLMCAIRRVVVLVLTSSVGRISVAVVVAIFVVSVIMAFVLSHAATRCVMVCV